MIRFPARRHRLRLPSALAAAAACGLAFAQPQAVPPVAGAVAVPAPAPAVSPSAQRLYERARGQLVQVRTLLKGQDSQASVGSGFYVSNDGLIVTNYHVVSQVALQPERYRLVYTRVDGREGQLQLLGFDAVHDLALVKALAATGGRGAAPAANGDDVPARPVDVPGAPLAFRPGSEPLSQGERLYSLGNPLDVGFAVAEGTYNGVVRRSFYPQIFFAGSLSAGMSGGPALDQQGNVVGINVARRVDGEQVSFLVPATYAVSLLASGREAAPLAGPAYAIVDAQLLQHQQTLTDRFIAQGWKAATHPRYRVPVPPDVFMRCWGSSEPSRTGGMDFERSDCVMDTRIFVGDYNTGAISVRHESYDGSKLGLLRFAARYSASFRNESFTRLRPEHQTKPQCHEDYVDRGGLPLRAVVCLRAYKKLPQLYDVSVLVATLDNKISGVLGRFDAQGLSFANAQRLARHYIEGYGWIH